MCQLGQFFTKRGQSHSEVAFEFYENHEWFTLLQVQVLKSNKYICFTAKRILERLGIQSTLHHRLSKFDRSVFLILKPISYFFGV